MQNRGSSIQKRRIISRRLFILASAKILLFAGITSRLYSLQISDREKYKILSEKNRIREWKTPPQRGLITDFYNKILANNDSVFQVHLKLDEVKNFDKTLFRLRNIIGLTDKEIKKIYKKKEKLKPWDTLVISNNLEWSEFSKLNLYLHELEGAKPVVSSSRYYPYGNDLVHIIGYVGEPSLVDIERLEEIKENLVPGLKVGKSGIEYSNEKLLIGKYGIKRYEVNSSGKRINQLEYIKESQGSKIKTTIDLELQKFAQELLVDKAGSICAMDIYTGEVIAMASSPTYDPNKFTHGIKQKDWDKIRKDPLKPLINKSIAGLYSPGSTFKPLVALAALEFGTINSEKTIRCKGHKHPYELYGMKYHCWKKEGHGYMKLRNAIKQSCDIYFYEMARKLGVDRLSLTATKFGLGNSVLKGVMGNEKTGLVPNTKWKKNTLGTGWVLGETLITGIGQGYIQTTPLQLCLMTAQLANGGFKIYPKIVVDEKNQDSVENIKYKMAQAALEMKEEISPIRRVEKIFKIGEKEYTPLFRNPENVKFVLEAMFGSTNEIMGTSYASRIEDKKYQFAGKTGTAQVKKITEKQRELDLDISQIPYEERDHALYIAFGPYINPRYALSILIEHGGSGSKTAAPIAKKLFKLIIDRHELREKEINKNLTKA